MEANKLNAFMSGITVTSAGIFIENGDYPFILIAVFFFPAMFIFVIGFEIWREFSKGVHVSTFPVAPKDSEGWRIYGRVWLRMLIFFLGGSLSIMVYSVWPNI